MNKKMKEEQKLNYPTQLKKVEKLKNHNNGAALNETYEIIMNELNHNNFSRLSNR